MSTRIRGALVSAAALCGLVLSGTATAVAADGPHSDHSAPKSGGVTLRLAAADGGLAAVKAPSSVVALDAWSADPRQGKFQTWSISSAGSGKYTIKSDAGTCLKWDGPQRNGTPVVVAKCAPKDKTFRWHFVRRAAGYQIETDGNLCLNVAGGAYLGHSLLLYTCAANGAPNDVWLPAWQG